MAIWLVFACMLLLIAPEGAMAAPSEPDIAAEADLRFRAGVRLYQQGRYAEALEHLLLSNRLAANRKVGFNIARCYEALEQHALAWRHYSDFMTSAADPAEQAMANEAIVRLEPHVARVEIRTEPPGAEVYVDRKDLGLRGTTPRILALEPGTHTLLLEREGRVPASITVEAVVARLEVVEVDLDPLTGTVVVQGTLPGAVVRVDGEAIGAPPLQVDLPIGNHDVAIEAPGHEPGLWQVSVREGARVLVLAALDPIQGQLIVDPRPDSALIEVDGEPRGFARTVVDLPAGTHRVRVSAEGYRSFEQQIVVDGDAAVTLAPDLAPLAEVRAPSRVPEALVDAPASVLVLDREDIVQRGYTDLAELVMDLPGFDTVLTNGTTYMVAYQRGYRTPNTQRTLLMIDGRIENLLWTQHAEISRQYPLSMIERVEVVYGPASAVYGPNAFLGVINIITRRATEFQPGEQHAELNTMLGSFDTRAVDASTTGRLSELRYSIAARVFRSDEPDFSDRHGFLSRDDLASEAIWGPILDIERKDQAFGTYADPTDDLGLFANLSHGGFEVGVVHWVTREGYGPFYAADRAQPSAQWEHASLVAHASHRGALSDRVTGEGMLLYRTGRLGGDWAEASGDGLFSDVSYTRWNNDNRSWYAQNLLEYAATSHLTLTGGIDLERRELTKQYDVPGYWPGSYSSQPVEPGSGIVSSLEQDYTVPPPPVGYIPADNLAVVDDVGGFAQAIVDVDRFRFHGSLRYDRNSVTDALPQRFSRRRWNPRVSAIMRLWRDQAALKLIYGEASQEPAARQLWGGWNGRAVNPDLLPEKVRNAEVVAMARTSRLSATTSVFAAFYEDVIREEADNFGDRVVTGLEARGTAQVDNPIPRSEELEVWGSYALTRAVSDHAYDHDTQRWVQRPGTTLGDIAPHKVHAGLHLPVLRPVALTLRASWVSRRELYGRNPLRAEGTTLDPYLLLVSAVSVEHGPARLMLKVHNVADADIMQPGVDAADAGMDFSKRSLGYNNSVIPLPRRYVLATATITL